MPLSMGLAVTDFVTSASNVLIDVSGFWKESGRGSSPWRGGEGDLYLLRQIK